MIEFIRNHYFELLYDLLLMIIAGVILFAAVIFWVILKRWYSKAKIRRHGKDFKEAVEYIREKDKKMNALQRFLQGQTGVIVDISLLLWCVLPCVILCIVFFVLGKHMGDDVTEVVDKILPCVLVLSVTATLVALGHCIYGLIKYARILPFVFWALLCAWYLWWAIPVLVNRYFPNLIRGCACVVLARF